MGAPSASQGLWLPRLGSHMDWVEQQQKSPGSVGAAGILWKRHGVGYVFNFSFFLAFDLLSHAFC